MRLQSDQALVDRDRDFPGLAILLDGAAMRDRIQAHHPHLAVQAVTSTYVRYKPQTNCLVAYDVTVNDQVQPVYGKAFAPAYRRKLAKYQHFQGWTSPGGLQPQISAEEGLAIAPFPVDKVLRSLPLLGSGGGGGPSQELLQVLGLPEAAVAASPLTLDLIHYKPERRWVGRLQAGQHRWAIKAYSAQDSAMAITCSRRFQSRDQLHLLPIAGYNQRQGLLAFPWRDDPPLVQRLRAADLATLGQDLQQVGLALATLHHPAIACAPSALGQRHRDQEALVVLDLIPVFSHLAPALTPAIQTLGQQLAHWLRRQPPVTGPLHGDFKPDQVLMAAEQVTFLDLDRATLGHPAYDVGSFLARLAWDRHQGRLSEAHYQAGTQGFMQGYRRHAPDLASEAVHGYTTLHLFKLISEPFRYRVPDWPAQMDQRVQQIADRWPPHPD